MRFRRSTAYVGDNRCWPCTLLNLAIAAVIALGIAPFSPLLAGGFTAVAVFLIASVGYLVPGTPTITRNVVPERILTRFGKGAATGTAMRSDGRGDASDRLVRLGVLDVHDEDDSLSLSSSFERAWSAEKESLADNRRAQREALASLLDVEPSTVAIEPIDSTGALSVRLDDGSVSQWLSRSAILSDLAAERVLSGIDTDWAGVPFEDRHAMLVGLRQFNDRCPACNGDVVSRPEDAATCCWTTHAVTARCRDCADRLYVIAGHPA